MKILKSKFIIMFLSIFVMLLTSCANNGGADAKPVIYLYPREEQEVTVKLDYKGDLTVTYPEYKDGWNVIASPDGTLINKELVMIALSESMTLATSPPEAMDETG